MWNPVSHIGCLTRFEARMAPKCAAREKWFKIALEIGFDARYYRAERREIAGGTPLPYTRKVASARFSAAGFPRRGSQHAGSSMGAV
jgi:hypothetical protein